MKPLTVEYQSLPGGVELFAVEGQIDLGTIQPLEAAVDAAIEGGARLLLFDFTALDFLDSSALNLLERTRKRLGPTGNVTVACAGPVMRAFELTGLDRIFSVTPSRQTALDRLLLPGSN